MKTIIALVFALLSNVASAAYTYTYTNVIPTVYTDTFPLFYGGEPTTENRLRPISFSVLLDNRISPDTTYEYTDVLATSFSSLSRSGYYISSVNPLSYVNLQTDNTGMINDWSFNTGGGGHFSMGSEQGIDYVSEIGPYNGFDFEEGQTTANGHWLENRVTYKRSESYFDGDLFTVTPVPEPKTYVMFLVGVGIIGFASRRKHILSKPTKYSIAL